MEGRAGAADFNRIAETFLLKFLCCDSNSTTRASRYRYQQFVKVKAPRKDGAHCAVEKHCSQMRVKEIVRVILMPKRRIDNTCQNGRDMVASLPSTSAQLTGVKKRERCSWALRMVLLLFMFAAVPAHDDACLRGELLFPSLSRARTNARSPFRAHVPLFLSLARSLPPSLPLALAESLLLHTLSYSDKPFFRLPFSSFTCVSVFWPLFFSSVDCFPGHIGSSFRSYAPAMALKLRGGKQKSVGKPKILNVSPPLISPNGAQKKKSDKKKERKKKDGGKIKVEEIKIAEKQDKRRKNKRKTGGTSAMGKEEDRKSKQRVDAEEVVGKRETKARLQSDNARPSSEKKTKISNEKKGLKNSTREACIELETPDIALARVGSKKTKKSRGDKKNRREEEEEQKARTDVDTREKVQGSLFQS